MLKKRIHNKKAFTLAETLVAILIMLMASSILVTGIPAAKNAYEKVFIKSNAEMLMSTGIYSLRNELTLARNVTVDETKISFFNSKGNVGTQIFVEGGVIKCKRYGVNKEEQLISDEALDTRYLKYESAVMVPGEEYITINRLGVYKNPTDSYDEAIVKRDTLKINVL